MIFITKWSINIYVMYSLVNNEMKGNTKKEKEIIEV